MSVKPLKNGGYVFTADTPEELARQVVAPEKPVAVFREDDPNVVILRYVVVNGLPYKLEGRKVMWSSLQGWRDAMDPESKFFDVVPVGGSLGVVEVFLKKDAFAQTVSRETAEKLKHMEDMKYREKAVK